MAGHGEKMSRKQEQAIAALLAEPTVERAAEKAGVAHRTLKGWLAQPGFKAAYRKARTAVMEEAVTCLQRSCMGAVQALNRNLEEGLPATQVKAATAILDRAIRGAEFLDLLDRIEELERRSS